MKKQNKYIYSIYYRAIPIGHVISTCHRPHTAIINAPIKGWYVYISTKRKNIYFFLQCGKFICTDI